MKKNRNSYGSNSNVQPEFWQPIEPKKAGDSKRKQTSAEVKQPGRIKAKNESQAAKGVKTKLDKNGKPRNRLTRRQKVRRAVIISVTVLSVLLLAGWLVWDSLMDQINIIDSGKETLPEEYNVPTESLKNPLPDSKGVTNILLLGVDSRDPDSIKTNSDSMMILTIDQNNKSLKLTSLQRDMLVYYPGKNVPQKINAANSAGGPAMAMRVVNETFRLNIKNYVIVNMLAMEDIINIAGGVMIDVEQAEIEHINSSVNVANLDYPDLPKSPFVTEAGRQLLNGRQAVSYARIRALQGWDYARMSRQRVVLQALLDRFSEVNVVTKTNMITEGLPYITTNLTENQIMELGLKVLPIMQGEFEQLQIPIDGYYKESTSNGWSNLCDYNGMIPLLQEFIWGKTFPFDPVKEIPGAPNSSLNLPEPTTRKTTTTAAATTVAATTTSQTTTTAAATTTVETTVEETTEETTKATTEPSGSTKETTEEATEETTEGTTEGTTEETTEETTKETTKATTQAGVDNGQDDSESDAV